MLRHRSGDRHRTRCERAASGCLGRRSCGDVLRRCKLASTRCLRGRSQGVVPHGEHCECPPATVQAELCMGLDRVDREANRLNYRPLSTASALDRSKCPTNAKCQTRLIETDPRHRRLMQRPISQQHRLKRVLHEGLTVGNEAASQAALTDPDPALFIAVVQRLPAEGSAATLAVAWFHLSPADRWRGAPRLALLHRSRIVDTCVSSGHLALGRLVGTHLCRS
jgi:hypothetical protein